MTSQPTAHLISLGLGGDGDEVEAIQDVERHFGVSLNHADAATWVTVGDVFASLKLAVPQDGSTPGDLWKQFAGAISYQTDVDPTRVAPETLLLAPSSRLHRAVGILLIFLVGASLAVVKRLL